MGAREYPMAIPESRLKRVLPRIHTDRAVLCLLAPEFAELMVRFRVENRYHLTRWEPSRSSYFFTPAFWKAQLAANVDSFRSGESCCLVILNQNENEVLGVCNFTQIARGTMQSCHLGYALAAIHEGQGLMREALTAAIDYVFLELELHRIMAGYIPHNKRSAGLLKRLGFEIEGQARQYLRIDGKWQDHVLTAMINPFEPDC